MNALEGEIIYPPKPPSTSPIELWFPELNPRQRKKLKEMLLEVIGDSEEMVNVMIKMEHGAQLDRLNKLFGEDDETNLHYAG